MDELFLELRRRGLTQGDVAREMGLTQSAVSKILSGATTAPADFEERFRAAIEAAAKKRAAVLLGEVSSR